ncbi:e06327cc-4b78-42d9-a1dd-580f55d66c8b [Thermothielavioides terrestris]|uniref:E06327cc-4b78-42d9-a1dd-580f55d66c8b n=1 Tax=Thermothielavioides terrestris TaxID=2587410 RepID=A0A3S4AVQ4_9PEZI|nr:e06327cc-4b78-42d9-a1dd-580f55d66c8b [Thermothielavioides terrestris]
MDEERDGDELEGGDGGGGDEVEEVLEEEEEEEEEREKIPPELLTRILHEFFEKEGTRITRDANAAVARYMDVFVREAIARAAVERASGFLEVEDLEKIAPQLLMDL